VRKEARRHGTGRDVEGPVEEGDTAYIVEDTGYYGGSSLRAIERAEAAGFEDPGRVGRGGCDSRGGREAFSQRGYPLQTLLTVQDLGIQPAGG